MESPRPPRFPLPTALASPRSARVNTRTTQDAAAWFCTGATAAWFYTGAAAAWFYTGAAAAWFYTGAAAGAAAKWRASPHAPASCFSRTRAATST